MGIPRFRLDGLRRHKLITAANARRLPPIRSQEGKGEDAIAFVKLFGGSRYTMYVTEFDGTDELYGFTVSPLGPDCDEWGYSSLEILAESEGPAGIPLVERDQAFEPREVWECLGRDRPSKKASASEVEEENEVVKADRKPGVASGALR